MMKKIYIYLLSLIMIGALVGGYYMMYVPFQPTSFDLSLQHSGYKPISVNRNFYTRLIKVLDYHGVGYIQQNGKIYIRRKDARDKEVIWNFTTKALSDDWINTH